MSDLRQFRVGVPVSAENEEMAAQVMVIALGADIHSINDIGGLRVAPILDDPPYAVCRQCGEAFDDMTIALGHAGTCGSDQGFDILPESEAM